MVFNCCGSVGGSVKENQEKGRVTALLKPNPVLKVEEKELDQNVSGRFLAMSFVT